MAEKPAAAKSVSDGRPGQHTGRGRLSRVQLDGRSSSSAGKDADKSERDNISLNPGDKSHRLMLPE